MKSGPDRTREAARLYCEFWTGQLTMASPCLQLLRSQERVQVSTSSRMQWSSLEMTIRDSIINFTSSFHLLSGPLQTLKSQN